MFCKNCGAEMSDNAKFCPKCGQERAGSTVENSKKIVEDNTVIEQLKPEYVFAYKFIGTTLKALLWALLLCIWFSDNAGVWFIYPRLLLIPLACVAIYVIIKLILDKKQYDKLQYNFYKTKVEYRDGFLNKEEKELKYKHIREVTMTQNILERMFGLGTIRVFTNASSGGYNYGGNAGHNNMRGRNGIFIHCIKNVQEQYKKIKEIIDEGTPEDND